MTNKVSIKHKKPSKTSSGNSLSITLIKVFGGLIGLIILLDIIGYISTWLTFVYIIGLLWVGITAIVLTTNNGHSLLSKLFILLGFTIGFILVVIPEPLTTLTGIGIMGFTAYKLGWLGENTLSKLRLN